MDLLSSLTSLLAARYEVDREIGRGGMATVYLARDVRHNRKVAVKVLNPELGAVLGVERFLAEIQVTANLQHPNVLPLYDSGSGDGLLFYVMPFVEGESLRDRLERERQLPIDDAVRIATAVAGALDYAHRHGVVHRDLKPENILLQDGQPLVADFGIALAVTNAGGNRITQTGLSLGTPQYMSPEQATGERVIDGRADIYSLGAVLYEMLAGDPPHIGGSTQAVIAKALTEKPTPVRNARDTVPEHIAWAVERALAKVPADRWQTAHDFAEALAGNMSVTHDAHEKRAIARKWMSVLPWAVAAVFAAVAAMSVLRGKSSAFAAKAYVSLPGASLADGFNLSPSGAALVYVGRAEAAGAKQLYVRDIGQLDARPVPGSDGAQDPMWSPDGHRILFDANGKVVRVARDGGSIDVVSPSIAYGHDWLNNESVVLGSAVTGTGLRIVEQIGTPPREVTHPDFNRGESFHVFPLVLRRDRAAFVSWGPGGLEDDYLGLADLKTGKYVLSKLTAIRAVTMIDDWLVYLSPDRRLMAVRCDLGRMDFLGAPVTLVEDAVAASITPAAALLVTGVRTTSLTRLSLGASSTQTLVQNAGTILSPRVSPDGRRVAYALVRRDGADLLLYDLKAGTSSVLRSAPFLNDIEWLPDGRSLIFYETAPDSGLWQMSVEHPSERTPITAASFPREPAVMRDGKSMVFTENLLLKERQRGYTLEVASLTGPAAVHEFGGDRIDGFQAAVSPNGRWLAHSSIETGQAEVYVRSLTASGSQIRVSTNGGVEPRWSRDGASLFYRIDRTVMRARLRENGSALEVLSRDSVASFTISSLSSFDMVYDVGANSNELFVAAANEKDWQLVFAQNWSAEARQRLAAAHQ